MILDSIPSIPFIHSCTNVDAEICDTKQLCHVYTFAARRNDIKIHRGTERENGETTQASRNQIRFGLFSQTQDEEKGAVKCI